VIAADDIQAAADAILARRTGLRRMYVVSNLDTYGAGISSAFRRAARHLGLRIVGLDSYPDSIDYGPLVARIAHTRPDGVFLAGSLQDGGVIRFLRTLRAGLGTRVQIMTSDGFAPASDLVAALGPAAEGITVSVAGVPNERLGPAGRRFVQSFERSVGEPPVEFVAAAAQAAEILLEAIARSDGTRSSVTANLLQAQVSNGILGSFRFTPAGDTTAPHVTIYRILRGKPTVAAVLKPPASLVKP
jgi:branched-chain amino acid transport system substrate-binding protein